MVKRKILIIDDEKVFADLVKEILEETDRYEVEIESKGHLGLHAVKRFHPDLILLDLVMPDIEGSIVAEQIKNDKDSGHIPIIFLTGAVTEEEAEEKNGLIGGQLFLAKPVGLTELMESIEKTLQKIA